MGGSGGHIYSEPDNRSTRGVGNNPQGEGNGSGGGGGGGQINQCLRIDEQARLSSPQAAVVATLSVGDTLHLRINGGLPPVQAIAPNGEIAGSVVPSSLNVLIGCMNDGVSYQATVVSIEGGICVVRVSAQS